MIRILALLCFLLVGTHAHAQATPPLTDEGRLTTLDVQIIQLHAILLTLCPGKPGCAQGMERIIGDMHSVRKRMEAFFKSKNRPEKERLAINVELERLAREWEALRKKYNPVTRDIAQKIPAAPRAAGFFFGTTESNQPRP